MIVFADDHRSTDEVAAQVRVGLRQDAVTVVPLPALLHGEYEDAGLYLRPMEQGRPFAAMLAAYDWSGDIDLYCTHRLLALPIELALVVDVKTLDRTKATTRTVNAHTTLKEQLTGRGKWTVKDPNSERAYTAAEYALQQLDTQTLHTVRMAVLVQGRTYSELHANIQLVENYSAGWIRWDRFAGSQQQWIKVFTMQPTSALSVPLPGRTNLSETVAAKVPYGFLKTTQQDGNYWGIDLDQRMVIHHNPWRAAAGNDEANSHLLLVGMSGSGKTVLFNTLGLRRAVAGDQVIYADPVGKCKYLAEAVGINSGSALHTLQDEHAINPLDPAVVPTQPGALRLQVGHVQRKLQVVLGRAYKEGDRITFLPRILDNFEEGALQRALTHPAIYGSTGEHLQHMSITTAPRLEDLAAVLRKSSTDEGRRLGAEIEAKLLGVMEPLFNHPTTLRFDFSSAQVICYSFANCDPVMLPLYYDLLFSEVNVYLRNTAVRRTSDGKLQKLIFMLDEYKLMSSVPAIRADVAMATKTWRNYGGAMWSADQNASVYFGDLEWGQWTATNTLIKIFMRQEDTDAEALARAYSDRLTDYHLEIIRNALQGEGIVMFDRDVHYLRFELTNDERAYFVNRGTP